MACALYSRYAIQNGKPTCDSCVQPPPAGVGCSVCFKPIGGGGITVMGACMHAECFKCTGCRYVCVCSRARA